MSGASNSGSCASSPAGSTASFTTPLSNRSKRLLGRTIHFKLSIQTSYKTLTPEQPLRFHLTRDLISRLRPLRDDVTNASCPLANHP